MKADDYSNALAQLLPMGSAWQAEGTALGLLLSVREKAAVMDSLALAQTLHRAIDLTQIDLALHEGVLQALALLQRRQPSLPWTLQIAGQGEPAYEAGLRRLGLDLSAFRAFRLDPMHWPGACGPPRDPTGTTWQRRCRTGATASCGAMMRRL